MNRNWLVIQFFNENSLDLFAKRDMLAVPQYGDYLQFPNISKGTFQVIGGPKHVVGKSPKSESSYHYISVQIREIIPPEVIPHFTGEEKKEQSDKTSETPQ